MAFEDVPLDRPPAPRRSPVRSSSTSRWVILAAGTIIAVALLALLWLGRAQPSQAPLPPTSPTDARSPGRPRPQPLELPPLAESDSALRELFATLSHHPLLAKVLAQPGIVRAAVLAVVQIGDGKTPAVPLDAMRPAERLTVTTEGNTTRLNPTSYARWDGPVKALLDINAADAAQVYVNVKRLFDEAYSELGYPNGNFDDAIARAIKMLVDTPDVTTPPVLITPRPTTFEHDDPALRSLRPVQKQLLLIGPEHRRQVLAWLRQFAATLMLKID
jgi:hypothetical protein